MNRIVEVIILISIVTHLSSSSSYLTTKVRIYFYFNLLLTVTDLKIDIWGILLTKVISTPSRYAIADFGWFSATYLLTTSKAICKILNFISFVLTLRTRCQRHLALQLANCIQILQSNLNRCLCIMEHVSF